MQGLVSAGPFRHLTGSELDRIAPATTMLSPPDGARVFSQGDLADAVYVITAGTGHVRIGAEDLHSKALMVEVLNAGEMFGEIGVIDGEPRTASAVVEGRVTLAKIHATAFLDLLGSNPRFAAAVCRMLVERLRRTFALFQDATFATLEVRLARQILYLASREGTRTREGVRLGKRLRQSDLADLLGTTNRSIIAILNSWRSHGLVGYDTHSGFLTILDQPALKLMVNPSGAPASN